MHTKKLKVLTLVATIAVMSNIFGIQSVFAVDASQTVNTAVGAGSTLSITLPGEILNLSGATASSTSTGTSTGTISPITITDDRGTGAGWTVSSTSTNLGLGGTYSREIITGNGTTTLGAAYDGMNPQAGFSATGTKNSGQFVITVDSTTGGIPTQIDITKPDTSAIENQAIISLPITLNGLTINFGGTWAANDILRFSMDHFPYTAMTITPSNLASTNGGSTAGISLQNAGAYAGSSVTSSSRNELIAPANTGMGVFTFDLGLSQTIHKFPLVGTYRSTITLSII